MENLFDTLTSLPFWVGFVPGFALGLWQTYHFMKARFLRRLEVERGSQAASLKGPPED